MKDYKPLFKTDQPTVADKWGLIRTLIEDWYDFEIPKTDDLEAFSELEKRLNLKLPAAIKAYFLLSKQLKEVVYTYPNGQKDNWFANIFRDGFIISDFKGHNAITLMVQAEQDMYWAIKKEDLLEDDPAVYCYLLDYDDDTNEKFDFFGLASSSVSSFVTDHLLSYLSNCSTFAMPAEDIDQLRTILKLNLANHYKSGDLEIFEDENIIAFFSRNIFEEEDSYSLYFHLKENREISSVPAPFLDLLKQRGAGWTSGRFNDYR
ncbi:hypothetical protein [Pedobacter caeni]|uniref:SMI1 / KNR4 family (SUKH-1) n=1 Tax=Pedobacter caeni TaxID=288992 RepID=A0A1M4TYJ8_9SPHI|nr:hypothetical protein [Pedobacter caeni]SHE49443.1 hypothetical protein SAMN04488522_101364 [Pedobacter caeni]